MSIFAYVGLPGSGKSYDVVANQIVPALKAGRTVVTNLPLNEERVRAMIPGADLRSFPIDAIAANPASIDEYVPRGCVLVVDEAWKLWPSGQKVDKVPGPFKSLLAEHRHMVDMAGNSTQIVIVTQDLAQIGAFARQLVEQTFYHTKLSHLGSRGSYRIDVYHGPRSGPNPPREARLREIFGRYERRIFELYQSHTMSERQGSGANEASVDARGNIWRRPMIWITAGACVVFLLWGVPKAAELLHNPTGRELAPASVATGRELAPGRARRTRLVESRSAGSGRWRVAGVLEIGERGEGLALLEREDGATVTLDLERCWVRRYEVVCDFDGGRWSTIAARPRAASGAAPDGSRSVVD